MSARESIAEALEKFQACFERAMSPTYNDLARDRYQMLCSHLFTHAYLLEALRQRDEAAADQAEAFLGDCGEVMAEVVGEWRWQLATGRPMSMPDLTEETS